MKTIQHGLLVSACWLLAFFICLSPASAAVQTFHAKGEYTMSDYETPSVAEERAFAYAKRSAAEQAGVYVASYTKSTGAQISEDRVNNVGGDVASSEEQNRAQGSHGKWRRAYYRGD